MKPFPIQESVSAEILAWLPQAIDGAHGKSQQEAACALCFGVWSVWVEAMGDSWQEQEALIATTVTRAPLEVVMSVLSNGLDPSDPGFPAFQTFLRGTAYHIKAKQRAGLS